MAERRQLAYSNHDFYIISYSFIAMPRHIALGFIFLPKIIAI